MVSFSRVGEVARGMIEDVHGAVFDLVELIKTFQNKNRLSRLFMSTLFKRRQEELDAVVDRAIMRLQVSGGTAFLLSCACGVFLFPHHGWVCSIFAPPLGFSCRVLS